MYLNMHNFIINNADTDSILFSKEDGGEFSKEEQISLIKEINSLLPEMIEMDHDGYFRSVVIVKAKNYILYNGSKITIKGSALKGSTKEPALKEMMNRFIEVLIMEGMNLDKIVNIYTEYVIEARDIKDITRWSTRKTITEAVLNPERTNEQKVADALEGEEFQAGDRRHFYFKEDSTLGLSEHFDGKYNKDKLYEKIWKTATIFDTIIDKGLFIKYSLKKNREAIEKL